MLDDYNQDECTYKLITQIDGILGRAFYHVNTSCTYIATEAVNVIAAAEVCLCAAFCKHASCGGQECRADRGQSLCACTLCWAQQPRTPLQTLFFVPTLPKGLTMRLVV